MKLPSKPITQFNDREANHSRVKTKRSAYFLLCRDGAVEAHDEIMAIVVLRLVFRGRARKAEGAPIRNAADYTIVAEDLATCVASDPSGQSAEGQRRIGIDVLFYFVQITGSNLGESARRYRPIFGLHTTAMSSYSIALRKMVDEDENMRK